MKIKTSELSGAALDWAVAKCEGHGIGALDDPWFAPSTNWSHGGPIIEREKMGVFPTHGGWASGFQSGPTPLIAAMRRYVASQLGDEVDVPEELSLS